MVNIMNPNNNSEYYDIFVQACSSSDISHLARLIADGKFQVNKPLFSEILPIYTVIQYENPTVLNLLLEKGADPNADNGMPLEVAISGGYVEMTRLLLDKGAILNHPKRDPLFRGIICEDPNMVSLLLDRGVDVARKYDDTTFVAIQQVFQANLTNNQSRKIKNLKILKLLFEYASQLVDRPGVSVESRCFGKYARLCKAILEKDVTRVTELVLGTGDYFSYAKILDELEHQPACLAVNFGGPAVIEVFLKAGLDLKHIYWQAVRIGDLELVKKCAMHPNFDPRVRTHQRQTAMHFACRSNVPNQMNIIRFLIDEYALEIEAQDHAGYTPFLLLGLRAERIREFLAEFPETDVNHKSKSGIVPLNRLINKTQMSYCNFKVALFEHGSNPALAQNSRCRTACGDRRCNVVQYLQKMRLVDADYVKSVLKFMISPVDVKRFHDIKNLYEDEYLKELEEIRNIQINFSRTVPMNLLDFFLFGANEAARYARNEVIVALYEEHKKDFCNFLPHYGFRLNFQLRRAQTRRERLESSIELLCFALGSDMPADFAELVFGFFSNKTLEHFRLDE